MMRSRKDLSAAAAVALISICGCSSPPVELMPLPPVTPIARENLGAALVEDSILGSRLSSSQAFKQIVADKAAPVAELKVLARDMGLRGLLPLLALREVSPRDYEAIPVSARAALFATALATAPEHDAFDWPSLPARDAGAAVVALGPRAVGALVPLLADRRRAYVGSGWKEGYVAELEELRVCDYALAFVSAMLGRAYVYDRAPAVRDAAIRELQLWLGSHPDTWTP